MSGAATAIENYDPNPNLKVWLDGRIMPVSEAQISVFDHGLLYGDGIFEGIRSYNGRIFACGPHLKRFFQSAKAIALKLPYTYEQIERAKTKIPAPDAKTYKNYKDLLASDVDAVMIATPVYLHPEHFEAAVKSDLRLSHDLPRSRSLALLLALVALGLLLAPFVFPGAKALGVAAKIAIFILLVASYDLLLGYTGIVSFAHTMFFGIGAYGVAIALTKLGAGWGSLAIGIVAGVAVATVLALGIGLLSLRVRAIFFSMITLAVASFALIQADDYDAAVQIARECPPGHTIEIRELAGYV